MNKNPEPLNVFLLRTFDPPIDDYFLDQLDENINIFPGPELPMPADYQILVAGRPTREHLAASPYLKALVIPWAGLPDETRLLLSEFPQLAVHNLHHNAAIVAESCLALLLAVAKQILPYDRSFRQNDWRMRYLPDSSMFLQGKTALILGYGEIGQRVGIYLNALGMRVLALRRDPSKSLLPDAPGNIYGMEHLKELLPQAQVLIVTLPLTEETEGLLGEYELGLLPQGAVLVNVGRGKVIRQAALYEALRTGLLSGAGLDVWYRYPQSSDERSKTSPADYPFNKLDNVVLSPHRAGLSADTETIRAAALADLLNAAACGKPIPNLVDVESGY